MNVSSVASSALEQILEELEQDTGASTSSTGYTSAASSVSSSSQVTSSAGEASTSTDRAVTQDLVDLLKSLASGDSSAAKVDLKKLATDMDSQNSKSATDLTNAMSSMSKALENGNTSAALDGLATYLIKAGLSTGNLVDTAA